jgi:hypothetical protein
VSTDITPYRNASLEEKRAYVQTLAQAGELLPKGLWSNIRNPETGLMENRPSPGKVMLVVETGVMLGLHPMAALQGIDIIEGTPTIKPALMSALIRQAGHSLRIVQTGSVETGDLAVTVTGVRSDDPDHPYAYTWTPFDALRAGLIDSYQQDANGVWKVHARDRNGSALPWERYTPRLCRWRALSDTASAGFEDVLMGMHYTAEELGAAVDQNGAPVSLSMPTPAEVPAPARDFIAELTALSVREAVLSLIAEARAADRYTDEVQAVALARLGSIGREAAQKADATAAAGATSPGEAIAELAEDEQPGPMAEPAAAPHPAPVEVDPAVAEALATLAAADAALTEGGS